MLTLPCFQRQHADGIFPGPQHDDIIANAKI